MNEDWRILPYLCSKKWKMSIEFEKSKWIKSLLDELILWTTD